MASRSRLISGIRQYLENRPDAPIAEGGMPEQTIYEVLVQVEQEMNRDLSLSDQNKTVDFEIVNISGETFNLASSNVGSPAYVQVQPPNDTFWYPVEIINHSSLSQARIDERVAVAFWGSDQAGEVSWLPEGETYRLRVWYDKTADEDGVMADTPIIGNDYLAHLQLQTAAQCRELLGLPVGEVLMTRLAKGERQWGKYVSLSRNQGVSQKRSFVPPWRRNPYGGSRRGLGGFRMP